MITDEILDPKFADWDQFLSKNQLSKTVNLMFNPFVKNLLLVKKIMLKQMIKTLI